MIEFKDLDFKGKKVLIRVDFNVPLDSGNNVTDNTRIKASIPTIKSVLDSGGSVVLMSHLGRPKGVVDKRYSLLPVVSVLSQMLGCEVKFSNSCVDAADFELSANLEPGEVLLLENLRFYAEEEGGSEEFAKQLAKHGDIYLNDAFGTAHRAHASTAIISNYFEANSKSFGLLMASEVSSLNKALLEGEHPVCAIIGGAKVSSKLDVLLNLIEKVDSIIIGGGMAFTFIKALGGNVGTSLVEEDKIDAAHEIMNLAKKSGVKIVLPVDSANNSEFADSDIKSVTNIISIPSDQMGLDVGPESIRLIEEEIKSAKTIIWNGPMGVFEFENYNKGTKAVGNAVAEATKNGAFSLVGGGDSVAAIKKFNLESKVSYVSTGGGAMLEFLEGISLPGIKAIIGV